MPSSDGRRPPGEAAGAPSLELRSLGCAMRAEFLYRRSRGGVIGIFVLPPQDAPSLPAEATDFTPRARGMRDFPFFSPPPAPAPVYGNE